MADPLQQQIIDAIKTRSATISVGNGYRTEIGSNVSEWKTKDWEPGEMPGMTISDPDTGVSGWKLRTSGGVRKAIMRVEIAAAVEIAGSGQTNAAVMKVARNALADIYKMVGVDQKWGGLAIESKPTNHSLANEQAEKIIAGCRVTFDIEYRFLAFDLETTG
jgi:hypothetical protein